MGIKWTRKDVMEHIINLKSPFDDNKNGQGGNIVEKIKEIADRNKGKR